MDACGVYEYIHLYVNIKDSYGHLVANINMYIYTIYMYMHTYKHTFTYIHTRIPYGHTPFL